jgi:hypothetical protein
MDTHDERTAHRCDNCHTEGPTARLDIGGGASTYLCVACWARLMAWRRQQNAGRKAPAFAILPWPLGGDEAPTPEAR